MPNCIYDRLHICVIRDPGGVKRRRRVFWHDALLPWLEDRPRGRRLVLEDVSWVDQMRTGRWLHFGCFEVIILNWGVINGNPMFAAGLSQRLARRYAPQLREFVRRGGLLVVECQADNWILQQDAYDAVLVGAGLPRLRVLENTHGQIFGKWVQRPRRRRGRAQRLFENAGDVIRASESDSLQSGRWFPAGSVPRSMVEQLRATRDRIYTGAFTRSWRRLWRPVLLTEDGKFPVACVYHEQGEGAYLVTSMHLASSGIPELLRPITVEWPDSRERLDR